MKLLLLDPKYEIGVHALAIHQSAFACDYWQVWFSILREARGGPD